MINYLKKKYQDYHYKKVLTNLIKKELIKELDIMIQTDDAYVFLSKQEIFKIVSFDSSEINMLYRQKRIKGGRTSSLNGKLQFELEETNDTIRNIIRNYYRELKLNRIIN